MFASPGDRVLDLGLHVAAIVHALDRATLTSLIILTIACDGRAKPKPPVVRGIEIVTVDECSKVAAHLQDLGRAVGAPTGSEVDDIVEGALVDACIGHATRTSYTCAMTATTTDAVMQCMEPAMSRASEGNHGDLTAAQCGQVIDRMQAMWPESFEGLDKSALAELESECLKAMTYQRYVCIVDARRPEELERCAPSGRWH